MSAGYIEAVEKCHLCGVDFKVGLRHYRHNDLPVHYRCWKRRLKEGRSELIPAWQSPFASDMKPRLVPKNQEN